MITARTGTNNFVYRKPLILEKISQEKPDIIGFQEVRPHVAVWLKENLPEYYVVGCGRGEDLAGEAMVIAQPEKPLSDREPRNLLAVADSVRAGVPLCGAECVPAHCDGCRIPGSGERQGVPRHQHPSGSRGSEGEKTWAGTDSGASG